MFYLVFQILVTINVGLIFVASCFVIDSALNSSKVASQPLWTLESIRYSALQQTAFDDLETEQEGMVEVVCGDQDHEGPEDIG